MPKVNVRVKVGGKREGKEGNSRVTTKRTFEKVKRRPEVMPTDTSKEEDGRRTGKGKGKVLCSTSRLDKA